MDKNSAFLQPGFRLTRLEVRNWGTFDQNVHVLNLAGNTALLIGENGSGKSTLVDALLTLLVPKNKRNYNLSAGGSRKRERDERTYVRGAYGSESSLDEARAQTKFLRSESAPPTILLACFENHASMQTVTLAQILWLQDDDLKHLFLLARKPATIQADFAGLKDHRTWKKSLRHRDFEVHESFTHYAERAVQCLCMESLTTLALFSQTVAIKEISNVSTFIREHMLERLDTKDLVERLEQHYEDLTKCRLAIQRARHQLDLLQPIVEKAADLDRSDAELEDATQFKTALPACFAMRERELITAELNHLSEQIGNLDRQITHVDELLTQARADATALERDLENDAVGIQLARVQEEIADAVKEQAARRAVSDRYHAALRALGLVEEVLDEHRFLELKSWAETQQHAHLEALNTAAAERAGAEEQAKQLQPQLRELEEELRSLRARPDLIPEEHRALRVRIAEGARVQIADLPFAGELMDVRASSQAEWRGALERLLHGFGVSILVPEALYSQVNRFINDNNMRRRVVYHRIPPQYNRDSRGHDAGRVIEKMTFKQGHSLAPWVESEVRSQFNHRCCESINEFETSTGYAITKQGLIRGGRTQHVKNDAYDIRDPRNYILGWSNREKLARFEQLVAEAANHLAELRRTAQAAGERQKQASQLATLAGNITGFSAYVEMDWRSSDASRRSLETRKEELERSSDRVRQLQEQLDQANRTVSRLDEKRTQHVDMRGGLRGQQAAHSERYTTCLKILETWSDELLARFDEWMTQVLAGEVVTIREVSGVLQRAAGRLNEHLLKLERERGDVLRLITKAMQRFLDEFKELQSDLEADQKWVSEFLNLREAIAKDDLPRHEERFKELMSRDVLAHVASFQDTLETHCDDMRAKIGHLNDTLRGIKYTQATYIVIRATPATDIDIRDFRNRLRSCLEFGLSDEAAAREQSFSRISSLIMSMREKPDWAAKVTDTRLWLSFGIEEVRRSDQGQENFWNDSGGKSGGQKAKLAFTILASAIAYQYRIAGDGENPQSFRFVVVDEMFARTDEENSRYALDLFTTFRLQLLIVSPFDARARVVEPYVTSYHLAVNPSTQSSGIRTISSIDAAERISKRAQAS